jgi:hypothetical protein
MWVKCFHSIQSMPYNSYTFQQICGGERGGEMAKRKLTSQFLNSNLESGRYYDDGGAGLNLHVRNSGSKNWSQKIRFQGKQYELGLGSFPMVSLAEARSIAAQNKSNVGKGMKPLITGMLVLIYLVDFLESTQTTLLGLRHVKWQLRCKRWCGASIRRPHL